MATPLPEENKKLNSEKTELNKIVPIGKIHYENLKNENKLDDNTIYEIYDENEQPMVVSEKLWGKLMRELKDIKKLLKEKKK